MKPAPRILIAKIGLDGHDRGVKLIVRALRDAGMHVIYTGLWQSPAATIQAAVQEDVDVVGVSLLSAAHMTILPELQRLAAEAGVPDTPLTVGGIIPADDGARLREMGVAGVYNPGAAMAAIVEDFRRLATQRRAKLSTPADDAPPDVRLARRLTQIVHHNAAPRDKPAGAQLVGVTGAPGVGKSTFIGKLARKLRELGPRVAVIAVDPSSPITGGALLGDRLRMMARQPDPDLFVRSLASDGASGGLAPHLSDVAAELAAAGYDIVLMETVGAGQNDVEIRNLTDRVLLVMMPGAGDAVQFGKAGVLEIASAVVLNKMDLQGADTASRQLRDALDDGRPVFEVSAVRDLGLDAVADWIRRSG